MIEFLIENPRMGLLAIIFVVALVGSLIIRWATYHPLLPLVPERRLSGLTFKEVGPISPEQYEVYSGDYQVGYVRYRFGNLTAEFPDAGGWCIFEKTLAHETGQMTDEERGRWLPVIAKAFRKCLREEARQSGFL